MLSYGRRKSLLAGMAEGGMPQIMAEGHGFGQILVQAERTRDRAGDLRHFERMREARAKMVALGSDEHLRLVGQASKTLRMNDLVAVALKLVAQEIRLGGTSAPFRFARERSVLRKTGALALYLVFTSNDMHACRLSTCDVRHRSVPR